jgi:hypothetical protein
MLQVLPGSRAVIERTLQMILINLAMHRSSGLTVTNVLFMLLPFTGQCKIHNLSSSPS